MKNIGKLILLALLLAACGDEQVTVSNEETTNMNEESTNTTQETTNPTEESINPSSEETNISNVTDNQETTAKLEIDQQVSGAWINSIDKVWVHSAAVLKNTGDAAIEINETQMNYKAQDGSILGTSTGIYSIPRVVNPGETAFIVKSTSLDGVLSDKDFKETTFNYNFEKTTDKPNLMEVSAVKGIDGDYSYKVTGLVKNPTDELQDDIRIAAALLDKNGNLLGMLKGSVGVDLAPGNEAGFELSSRDLPKDIIPKVAKIEVKSFGFKW